MGIRLDCPLCGAVVHDDAAPPVPGRCPSCTAHFAGGGERPADAAAAALTVLGLDGDVDVLARALFAEDRASAGLAVTSDRRDGFYAWWVFWRDGAEQLVASLAQPAGDTPSS